MEDGASGQNGSTATIRRLPVFGVKRGTEVATVRRQCSEVDLAFNFLKKLKRKYWTVRHVSFIFSLKTFICFKIAH